METIYKLIEKTNITDKQGKKLNVYECVICGKRFLKRDVHTKGIKQCRHNYTKPSIYAKERLFKIYRKMQRRCYDIQDKDYCRYGGRGIKICDEWLDYNNFKEWSTNNNYQDNLTIDRIDVNGNYEPSNCRWITKEENSRFKSTTNIIKVNNIIKSGNQWSKYLGRGKNYINNMLKKYGYDYTINYIQKRI